MAIVLGLGFGLGSASAAQSYMPQWMKYIFGGSGIVPATLIAILLNIVIPKDKTSESLLAEK